MFKIRDRVYSKRMGSGTVKEFRDPLKMTYPVLVKFDHAVGTELISFTTDGREHLEDPKTLYRYGGKERRKESKDLKVVAEGRIYTFNGNVADLVTSLLDKLCYTSEEF